MKSKLKRLLIFAMVFALVANLGIFNFALADTDPADENKVDTLIDEEQEDSDSKEPLYEDEDEDESSSEPEAEDLDDEDQSQQEPLEDPEDQEEARNEDDEPKEEEPEEDQPLVEEDDDEESEILAEEEDDEGDLEDPPVMMVLTNGFDAIEDEPLIRVSKRFSGLSQSQIDQLAANGFKITISSLDGSLTRDLTLAQGSRSETNGDIVYNWEIEGWPPGTYTVSEEGENLTNYTVVTENTGSVATVAASISWNAALWKKPNTQEYNDLKKNGYPPNIVATKLTEGDGVFVWTVDRLSASGRLAVVQALSGFNELGLTIDNGHWYSGAGDIAGEDFYFRGYKIQYDLSTGILHIPKPKQWALIVSGNYYFEGGEAADIAVKNSYSLDNVGLSIEKKITGNFGDLNRSFNFHLEVVGGDQEFNFALSNNEVEHISGIPAGSELRLSEEADGYEVTVRVGGNIISPNSDGSYTINLQDEDVFIEVTNHKDVVIDTGITLNNLPYILILMMIGFSLGMRSISRLYKKMEE